MKNSVFTVCVLLNIGIPLLFLIGSVQLDSVSDYANQVLRVITWIEKSIPKNLSQAPPNLSQASPNLSQAPPNLSQAPPNLSQGSSVRELIPQNDNSTVVQSFSLLNKLIPKFLMFENFMNVDYLLFTPTKPTQQHLLKRTQISLKNSRYDSSLETKIIIHGFQIPLLKENVFFDIRDELLLEGNYNVIVVNWTRYNQPPYVSASAYSVLVGLDIARLVHFIRDNRGVKAESFHIIGHSLGAHVAGFAGKAIPHLGRISGLDAAGPLFRILPNFLRLANTDAKFVDAIHTNGQSIVLQGYGMEISFAAIDFFPNGGSVQPGCKVNDTFLDTNNINITVTSELQAISCSHDRAPFLFAESINNTRCRFLSVFCNSYKDFNGKKCNSNTSVVVEMGFHAKPIPSLPKMANFYLKTSGKFPYCKAQEASYAFQVK